MNPRLVLGLTGATAATLVVARTAAAVRRWRRKSPDEIERLRRLDVHRRGRITHGHIIDVLETPADSPPRTTIVYTYQVAGVSYEVGQDITALPEVVARAKTLPGHDAMINYDQKQPANSIAVCEEWSGITLSND